MLFKSTIYFVLNHKCIYITPKLKAINNRKMNILRKIAAVVILISCTFCILSLLDYHPDDPSYLHLTDKPANNLFAKYGANIADPLIQAFGYATIVPLLVIAYSCITGRKIYMILLKISMLMFALPAFCFIFSIFDSNDITDGEYYNFHYAGYLGYFLYSEARYSEYFTSYTLIAIFISLFSLVFALGLLERIGNLWAKISFKSKISTIINRKRSDRESVHMGEPQHIIRDNPEIRFRAQPIGNNIPIQKASFDITSPSTPDIDLNHISLFSVANIQKPLNTFDITTEAEIIQSRSQFNIPTLEEPKVISKIFDSELPPKVDNIPLKPRNDIPQTAILYSNHNDFIPPTAAEIEEKKNVLLKVLNDFGIRGEITEVFHGPVVTLYCLEPVSGTKSSRVIGLADDIARSMKAKSARISIVKGKNALGIELPNDTRQIITLREILESNEYKNPEIQLPIALGRNIMGEIVVADLAKMPHLLVAGTTGSGKSVAIHSMILSLIFRYNSEECKFIMIDPKVLELSVYSDIPHLLAPVVTTPEKAVETMNWLVNEMSSRYRAMSTLGVRNITSYNNLVRTAKTRNSILEKEVQIGFDSETNQPIFESMTIKNEIFPYIVVIIDEIADLMMTAGKDIEGSVQRLAQMARAAGIHLIMATQRPSVDIITGVIKANFPTRISFQVVSRFDSRTILGEIGAEQLLGAGDMLYMVPGGKIERVHGTYVSESEVELIISSFKRSI
jgi:S-DNA-T family DNA segregation ATPase FtsK/SpoIIIE